LTHFRFSVILAGLKGKVCSFNLQRAPRRTREYGHPNTA